ncbi:MAG TPA: phage tail fiber protein, partial [Armatimonadota bacterium]|nr:phage tail fiber protein [Armatimonadota bacterium]
MSTYVNYAGDGVQTSFPVPFPFILREHVQVEVDGEATAFSWITDALISITPAPASGTVIRLFRVTPVDEPLVGWEDGAN